MKFGLLLASTLLALTPGLTQAQRCAKPVFLTFDTGHMGVAPLIAETLKRFDARATFFLANEPTKTGGWTLDEEWAPWWRERLAEGHDFGTHTWNHDTWLADLPAPDGALAGEVTRFKVSTAAGEQVAVRHEITAEQYCASLKQVSARFSEMTGQPMGPIFRAPGGKTSPALQSAAQKCGYVHVGWSASGFLGDELSSERYPNALLLERALKNIKPGDILMAHLGIWSRQEPWAPAVLEPLLQGLKDQGMCFAPLREHPRYRTLFKMAGLLQAAPATKDASHD
jgi:peptidoglycan/xylan/chitin deacetylase (PgdA/CDA1 family)